MHQYGCWLHTCWPCQGHVSDVAVDLVYFGTLNKLLWSLYVLYQYLIGISIKNIWLSAWYRRWFPHCPNDPRGFSSLSTTNQQIPILKSQLNQLLFSKLWMILKILNTLNQSCITARHERHNSVLPVFQLSFLALLPPKSFQDQRQSTRSSTSANENLTTTLKCFISVLVHCLQFRNFGF